MGFVGVMDRSWVDGMGWVDLVFVWALEDGLGVGLGGRGYLEGIWDGWIWKTRILGYGRIHIQRGILRRHGLVGSRIGVGLILLIFVWALCGNAGYL